MPAYYKKFVCKADKCRHTCCSGWKIPVTKQEYYKIINLAYDEELYRNVNRTFIEPDFPSDGLYRYIGFNWQGNCPMQKDGLCSLHASQGEEILPKVCKLYPRSHKQINDTLIASCSSSCEKVIEMLYDLDGLDIISDYLDEEVQIKYSVDNKTIAQIRAFHHLISDRSTTLVQSIKDICILINEDVFNKEYELDTNPLKLSLSLLNRLSGSNYFLNDIVSEISDRYKDNYELYEQDCIVFESRFPRWMRLFENVINNSMMYECFPFVDNRLPDYDTYKGLCAIYGLLRTVTIGYTSIHNSKEDLIDCIGALFHLVDHTNFYYNIHVLCDNAAILLKL